jgi:predicted DNA-binding transcriptional regulator AlpA
MPTTPTDSRGRRLIGLKDTKDRIGAGSRSSFHRFRTNPALDFPKPVYLGNKRPMWIEDEVNDFIERMAAARVDKPTQGGAAEAGHE